MGITNFTDEQDKEIVQLARKFVDSGKVISWEVVARRMKHTRLGKHVLCERLKTMKKMYGKDLTKFPPRFYTPLLGRRKPKHTQRNVRESPLLEHEVAAAIDSMFKPITKATVKCSGSRVHFNAGELSITGVSNMIKSLGKITPRDVFADLGSGLGNVVAHVALQTNVGFCVGIDIRADLLSVSKKTLHDHCVKFPHLNKMAMIKEDIREMDAAKYQKITILYASNQLYMEETNRKIEQLTYELKNLRYVILTVPFCHRHRDSCLREFCVLWKLDQVIEVETSWSSSLVKVHVFSKKSP